MKTPPTVWVLTDDKPGNRTQAIGIAEKLPWDYTEIPLQPSGLSKLPNRLLGATFSTVSLNNADTRLLEAPWPDIAIAAGRRLVPALLAIKKHNPACYIAYVMQPQARRKSFDLLAIPAHDTPADAANILRTQGAPHALTPDTLATARQKWEGRLSHLPSPRIALLVGGDSASAQYELEDFHHCAEMASALAASCEGSLMVTTSRRTGVKATDYLRLSLSVDHELFRWSPQPENPYHGFLALADAVIVTGDSMSMCAEACSLGKPVFIFAPRRGKLAAKLQNFHHSLFEAGYARPLTHGESLDWTPPSPLDEAGRIAQRIVTDLSLA